MIGISFLLRLILRILHPEVFGLKNINLPIFSFTVQWFYVILLLTGQDSQISSRKSLQEMFNASLCCYCIKKCLSDYDCKIHEALLIKKHQPKLNINNCIKTVCLFYYNFFNFSHVILISSLFFFFLFFFCEFWRCFCIIVIALELN